MAEEKPNSKDDVLGLNKTIPVLDLEPLEEVYSLDIARENLLALSRAAALGGEEPEAVAETADLVTKAFQTDLKTVQIAYGRAIANRRTILLGLIDSIEKKLNTKRVLTNDELLRYQMNAWRMVMDITKTIEDTVQNPPIGVGGERSAARGPQTEKSVQDLKRERAARDVMRELLEHVDKELKGRLDVVAERPEKEPAE